MKVSTNPYWNMGHNPPKKWGLCMETLWLHGKKKNHLSRCISYEKWWFSNVMLGFGGIPTHLPLHNTQFRSTKSTSKQIEFSGGLLGFGYLTPTRFVSFQIMGPKNTNETGEFGWFAVWWLNIHVPRINNQCTDISHIYIYTYHTCTFQIFIVCSLGDSFAIQKFKFLASSFECP